MPIGLKPGRQFFFSFIPVHAIRGVSNRQQPQALQCPLLVGE